VPFAISLGRPPAATAIGITNFSLRLRAFVAKNQSKAQQVKSKNPFFSKIFLLLF
jgi:hypothetical protein